MSSTREAAGAERARRIQETLARELPSQFVEHRARIFRDRIAAAVLIARYDDERRQRLQAKSTVNVTA